MDDFHFPPAKKMCVDPEALPTNAPSRDGQDDDSRSLYEDLRTAAQEETMPVQGPASEVDLEAKQITKTPFFLPGIGAGKTTSVTVNTECVPPGSRPALNALYQILDPLESAKIPVSLADKEPSTQQAQSLLDIDVDGKLGGCSSSVEIELNGLTSAEVEDANRNLEPKQEQDMHKDTAISGSESTVPPNEVLATSSTSHENTVVKTHDVVQAEQEMNGGSGKQSGNKSSDLQGRRPDDLSVTLKILDRQGESHSEDYDVPVFSPQIAQQTSLLENPDTESHGAEVEYDSSPYESSSSDSSSSSSSSDDDSDDDYQMLDPTEQARRLMEDDGGSDDEGAKKGGMSTTIRSLNEKPDEVVELPDIDVTPEMKIEELGNVETMVENLVLIKANTSGEYQVLETGSLLCLADRKVIGVVSETLGRVEQPRYCVRFTNATSISDAGLLVGKAVYYVPEHSTFVFTKALTAVKGSDASNIHDEEVGANEVEFSDDEAEAEYKRNRKMEKQAKRGGRGGTGASSTRGPRGPRSSQNIGEPRHIDPDGYKDSNVVMKYDDDSNADELYTPLSRPTNLYEMMGKAPGTTEFPKEGYSRGPRGTRGRGDRHRGGTRERGEHRGGFQAQRHPLPPPPTFGQSPSSRRPGPAASPQAQHPTLSSPPVQNLYAPRNSQYSQPSYQAQQHVGPAPYQGQPNVPYFQPGFQWNNQPSRQPNYQPAYQPSYNMSQPPHAWQSYQSFNQQPPSQAQAHFHPPPDTGNVPLPAGTFVNPNFFATQPQQQQAGYLTPATGYQGTNRR